MCQPVTYQCLYNYPLFHLIHSGILHDFSLPFKAKLSKFKTNIAKTSANLSVSACNREGKYRLILHPSLPYHGSSAAIHIYYSLLYSTFLFYTPRLVKKGEEKISGTRLLFKALCYALGHSHHTLAPLGEGAFELLPLESPLSLSKTLVN